jgi:hypothetical protein
LSINIVNLCQSIEHLEAELQVEIVLNDERMYEVYQNTLTDVNQGK